MKGVLSEQMHFRLSDAELPGKKSFPFEALKRHRAEPAKAAKERVDPQAKFPDWNKRDDIKPALKVGLILLLDEHGYPSVEPDEVYQDIFEQAENFKEKLSVTKAGNTEAHSPQMEPTLSALLLFAETFQSGSGGLPEDEVTSGFVKKCTGMKSFFLLTHRLKTPFRDVWQF